MNQERSKQIMELQEKYNRLINEKPVFTSIYSSLYILDMYGIFWQYYDIIWGYKGKRVGGSGYTKLPNQIKQY